MHERHAVHGPEQVSLEKCVEKMRGPLEERHFAFNFFFQVHVLHGRDVRSQDDG